MRGLRLLVAAFVVGAATMVLELVAPRMLAPHLGTTTLVWTVTIATFLLGLALGNAWGGRLADAGLRRRPRLLLFAVGAAVLGSLLLHPALRGLLGALPLAWRTLVTVPATFLPAAVALGMVPPWIARAALEGERRKGLTLGRVAAAATAGSVLGTLLAGFVLVPRLATPAIALGVAAACALLAFVLPRGRETPGGTRPARTRSQPRVPRASVGLAALAGGSLLLLEIAVARLGAERLGSSIYTWTSAIAVVLGGCALGNALGGRLADRHPPRRLLDTLLLLGVVAGFGTAWAPRGMDLVRGWEAEVAWPVRVGLAFLAAGFVPAFAIGTLSPVIARAALGRPQNDGHVVGALYAAGTVGAVLSTVATGYVVLPLVGLELALLGVPLLLIVALTVVRRRVPYLLVGSWLALAVLVAVGQDDVRSMARALRLSTDEDAIHVEDSHYARIRVVPVDDRWIPLEARPDGMGLRTDLLLEDRVTWDEDRNLLVWRGTMDVRDQARLRTHMESEADRRAIGRLRELTRHDVRALRLDRLVHSYVDLDDPAYLGYDYERIYDAVLRRHVASPTRLRALFLGGGGYSFQRRLLTTRPAALEVTTVEIDAAVTRVARRHLALADDARHRIHHEDARTFVENARRSGTTYDVVFGDAFDDLAVPFHLTTVEFAEAVAAVLEPHGLYLVNMVDTFDSGRFLAAFVATLERVFPHVAVITTAPRVDDLRNTFVLLASRVEPDLEGLVDESGRTLGTIVYPREEIEALKARTGRLVLRDDHAPVEILLAPVVEARN